MTCSRDFESTHVRGCFLHSFIISFMSSALKISALALFARAPFLDASLAIWFPTKGTPYLVLDISQWSQVQRVLKRTIDFETFHLVAPEIHPPTHIANRLVGNWASRLVATVLS